MVVIVALVVGLALGAAVCWVWARAAVRAGERELAAERAASAEKLALLQRTQERWEERVKAATGEALTRSQSSLLQLTGEQLRPIRETLDKFESQARALEERRLQAVSAVDRQLRTVAEGQERLRTETGNLVTALRAPHVRGRWGEVQLRRVVELAGMVAHCDFVEQSSERDDEGRLLRPDLVVNLPGGKTIVVDSKVPIEAYLTAVECDDPDERAHHLRRHAGQVRDHIQRLGQKQYAKQYDSPEFVVMFVDEGLFRAALDVEPALFELSARADVVLASPSTLIALLRTVAYGWQQETIAESARAVNRLGRELYERVGVFAGHFDKVGRALDSAVSTYNKAAASLETRLLVTARKFPEHGVSAGELPEVHQLERAPVSVAAPELPTLARVSDVDAA